MSDRESSDARRGDLAQFTRWRGLLSLSLGVLLGPTIALANQELIYASDMYACGRGFHGVLHIIPVLCLVVVAGAGIGAYLNWREVGKGVEDEHGGGGEDVQPPGEVHPLRSVDLHERDAVPLASHLGKQFPGRPAVGAHLSRELDEGRPRA